MRPPVPFPVPTRAILPPASRSAAFAALGCAATAVRAATWPWRRKSATRSGQAPERVCVIEPFGMGDAFLLQPLVAAHLDAGATVALAANPRWEALFPKRERFVFLPFAPDWAAPSPDRKYGNPLRDLAAAARALAPFARGAVGIDPRGDPRSIIALYLAGASSVSSLPVYWSATDCKLPPGAARFVPLDRNATRRNVSRAFAPAGAKYGRATLSHLGHPPRPADSPPRKASASFPIGLLPLTPWIGKRWPQEHWRSLAALLAKHRAPAVVLCGPGETSSAREAVGADLPVREVSSAVQWPDALNELSALVSVNTGPMHLADAMGIPLVVLDGASRLPLWAPEGDSSIVLHRQDLVPQAPWHPTSTNGQAVQKSVMSLVHSEDVFDALRSLGVLQS